MCDRKFQKNLIKIFEAIPLSNQNIGFVSEDKCNGEGASTSFNEEAVFMPYLNDPVQFRKKKFALLQRSKTSMEFLRNATRFVRGPSLNWEPDS